MAHLHTGLSKALAQPAVDQATAALLFQMDLCTERLVSRQAHESFAAETRQAREADRAFREADRAALAAFAAETRNAREADRAAHAAFATEMRTELKDLRTELKDLRTELKDSRTELKDLRTDVNNLRSDVQKLVDAVSAKVTKV